MVDHRLTKTISPERYQITIKPDLSDFSFTGSEIIRIEARKASRQITLHAVDLDISKAQLTYAKSTFDAVKISYHKKSETITISFKQSFSGKVRLYLEFSGSINETLKGFYRSRYLHGKKEKHLAVTQFEATDARRAFPCFDEPAHKAVFELSVVIPKHLKVISNTRERDVAGHEPGLKIINFEPTPKMSTYLLALIVGEFEHLSTKTKKGVQIRVHATPGKKAQGKFALETTKRALEFLEDYFGIPFPLPVLDMIAIPDFSAGAMENWGAITFRETALLVDDIHTSFIAKQRVAEVIAHELVHQWFGNLVTMEWWTHLWLNESFATYMAYLTTDKLFPEWNFWTKFVLEEQSTALYADCLKATQPVEVEVKHPEEISEIFDPAIVYAKGATILRMLFSYIGADNFQKGLQLYLKKHSYKNTSSVHLWEAFELASELPVRKFMKDWTTKPGYPMISADVKNGVLELEQSKFSLTVNKTKTLWSVPVMSSQVVKPSVLTKTADRFTLKPNYEYIKLNEGESSYFITKYSLSLLAQLLVLVEQRGLESTDRLSIIRNLILLMKAGELGSDIFLEALQYYVDDNSFTVWSEIDAGLEQLTRVVSGTPVEKDLEKFKAKLFGQLTSATKLGFVSKKGESENNEMLRGLAMLEAGLAGHKATINAAKKYFRNKLAGKHIPADIRLSIYSVSARFGTEKTLNLLTKIYHQSTNAQEKQQILFALTKVQGKSLQAKVMKFLLSSEVRGQDRPFLIAHALNQPSFKDVAWTYIKRHSAELEKEFAGSRLLGVVLGGARGFNTKAAEKEFQKLIGSMNVKHYRLVIAKTKEHIKINIAWQKRDLGLLKKYLKA